MPSAGETLRALADTVVPGPPDDPSPGAAAIEAEHFLVHYLEFVEPGLTERVCALLDRLASDRRIDVGFASLARGDRESILREMAEHDLQERRDIASLLTALSIAAVYGEWSGQDAEGNVVRRPLGWELSGWTGPRPGVRSLMRPVSD
ncbi:MAG: gluconate 2-dehydrogenase subunit 3 family protein [Actinomycetota bacterium]|nr:hypothetical protein [Actinomycetota bacterium]